MLPALNASVSKNVLGPYLAKLTAAELLNADVKENVHKRISEVLSVTEQGESS